MLVQAPLPPSVRLVQTADGLPRLDVDSPAATARLFCHGAQLTEWMPASLTRSVIWTSAHSYFQPGRPIRGGVPICFPWFGPHPGDAAQPAHGFVRLADWTLRQAAESRDGTVTLGFELQSDAATRRSWPHDFRLTQSYSIGPVLAMSLRVENTGGASFTFEEALHTYFAVSDIEQTSIAGLEDTEYLDKVLDFARRRQGDEPLQFTGETDRVYLETGAECRIADPGGQRHVSIATTHSNTTVVWNPWSGRARELKDFGDDEWRGMVCVESANVGGAAVRLAPGQAHTMTVEIRATAL